MAWTSPCKVFYGVKVAPEISEAICAPEPESLSEHNAADSFELTGRPST